MKLNGVFSVLFLLVAGAYAGRYYKKHNRYEDSSSSSSSEVEPYESVFAECFKPVREKREKKKHINKCEVYEPEKVLVCGPCEPPRRVHHKRHHHKRHHKGLSKKCRHLLCDIKCLVGESYLHVSQSVCAQFGELASCAKHSVENSSCKAIEAVTVNLKKLEKDVIEVVNGSLHRAVKRIEEVILETSRNLERLINDEFERFEELNANYLRGLLALADAALIIVIRDLANGLLPTLQSNTRELQRNVNAIVLRLTSEELRRIRNIAEDLKRDIEKEIRKEFQGAEMLIRSILEKIFDKECSRLLCLIEKRSRHVESRLRFVVLSVEREIEKAISCISSSKDDDCKTIRTKLAIFSDPHHGGEVLV